VGYRGKVEQQNRARDLRSQSWTLDEISAELSVAKSSVSLWVRGVEFEPRPRQRSSSAAPSSLHLAKLAQIEAMNQWGVDRIGTLSDAAFLAAGTALYAGEGAKRDHAVNFANSDPQMIRFFCTWFRHFFEVDESRLRVRVYLHQGLDIDAAQRYWSDLTGVPVEQFGKPYRAAADPTIRTNKHEHGCAYVVYSCSRTHRQIMGLIRALLSSAALPG
jgi:hypothetical protein